MHLLESPRLFLREFMEADAAELLALNSDPEVLRFTGDKPFASEKEARIFVRNYDHYRRHGIGRWAVLEKCSELFLGWCGLKYQPECDETDVGFRFSRSHWNKGYATEAAMSCLRFGFEQKNLTMIVGRAARANHSSVRVLEKLGMTYSKAIDFNGIAGVQYHITRNAPGGDWKTREIAAGALFPVIHPLI